MGSDCIDHCLSFYFTDFANLTLFPCFYVIVLKLRLCFLNYLCVYLFDTYQHVNIIISECKFFSATEHSRQDLIISQLRCTTLHQMNKIMSTILALGVLRDLILC